MKIRKAVPGDAGACERMRRKEEKRWSAIDFASSARDRKCIFLVAEENQNIIGYCIGFIVPTQKKEAMLHETRIVKTERGSGVGTSLVDAFCREAFRRKVKAIYAEIEPKLVKFYCKSCGFRKNARWTEVCRRK